MPLPFDRADAELLQLLQESAAHNRRTLANEVLYRLERSFDLRKAVIALRSAQQ